MSSYRRVEPAYCRGCGRAWTPGADACVGCGEALVAAQVSDGDPRALSRLRAGLVVGLVLLALRWGSAALLGAEVLTLSSAWIAVLLGPAALALLTVRWWYPGGWRPALSRPRAAAVVAAIVAGVAAAWGSIAFEGGEPMIALAAGAPLWIGLAIAGLLAEEVVFRGALFDGIEAFGGRANAAVAVTVLSALSTIDPVAAAVAAACAIARAWSGSLWPALALRVGWIAGVLAATL